MQNNDLRPSNPWPSASACSTTDVAEDAVEEEQRQLTGALNLGQEGLHQNTAIIERPGDVDGIAGSLVDAAP
jgi:hypothetical protein